MDLDEVANIPKCKIATYAHIVVNYHSQKKTFPWQGGSGRVRQHKKPAIKINKLEISEEESGTVRKVVPIHCNHREEYYLQSEV